MRIDPMLAHQPGQRRAMGVEMRLLHSLGLDRIAAQQPLDVGAHSLVDQLEQAGRCRIEAIVEIEDPVGDMAEQGGEARIHGVRASSPLKPFSKMKALVNHKQLGKSSFSSSGLSGSFVMSNRFLASTACGLMLALSACGGGGGGGGASARRRHRPRASLRRQPPLRRLRPRRRLRPDDQFQYGRISALERRRQLGRDQRVAGGCDRQGVKLAVVDQRHQSRACRICRADRPGQPRRRRQPRPRRRRRPWHRGHRHRRRRPQRRAECRRRIRRDDPVVPCRRPGHLRRTRTAAISSTAPSRKASMRRGLRAPR